jgi:putative flippase GtrA
LNYLNNIPSSIRFLSVAAAANLTHFTIFFLLEKYMPAILPEIANILAFCVAFTVSFIGHRKLSFIDTTNSVKLSLARFIVVAVAGFLSLEIVFSYALRILTWSSFFALFTGVVVAGSQTYLLSRFWAFHRKQG